MEMENALNDMKSELKKYKFEYSKTGQEHDRLESVLNELKNRMTVLDAKIQTANSFISFLEGVESHNKTTMSENDSQLDLDKEYAKYEPKQAYIEIAKKDFTGKVFRAKDLKKVGDEKGARTINGELVSPAYCRNIISLLVRNGDFEKIKAGLYKLSDKHLNEDKSNTNDIRKVHI